MAEITIRLATITDSDLDAILYHRRSMFQDMGIGTPEGYEKMQIAFRQWALPRMKSGEFLTWFACDGDTVVGGAGLWHMDWPVGPDGNTNGVGYIYNVYVEPEYRRQGIARRLVQTALDHCAEKKIKRVRLHASDAGRPLYEQLGFLPTNEMIYTFE